MKYVSIALIARDKFSKAVGSLTSLCINLPENSEILVFDSGYPPSIFNELKSIQEAFPHLISIIQTSRFANTNSVWNQFVSLTNSEYLMCLENDVQIMGNCIEDSINAITSGLCDIAVPIVYERLVGVHHFNPSISEIVDLPGKRLQSKLDRGRDDSMQMTGGRRIKHLERHCFIMLKHTALKLGSLDEQMYCRTDYDMSFQSHKREIIIGIPAHTYVLLNPDPDLDIDREFFDYRWNINRVAMANSRLIDKWQLVGFKTTIDHAHQARKYLEKGR